MSPYRITYFTPNFYFTHSIVKKKLPLITCRKRNFVFDYNFKEIVYNYKFFIYRRPSHDQYYCQYFTSLSKLSSVFRQYTDNIKI